MMNTNYIVFSSRENASKLRTGFVPKNGREMNTSISNDNIQGTDTYSGGGVTLTLSEEGLAASATYGSVRALASSTSTILKVGSRGTAVTELQKNLTKLGYDTKGTDGIFGNDTKNAVLSFQRAHGLTADGIVGAGTQSAIEKALNYHNKGILVVGSRGAAVTELQKNLTKLGYNTNGTDGIFGAGTQSAVLAFQRDYGLSQDGMVGSETQKAINAAIAKLNTTPPVSDNSSENGTSLGKSGYQFLVELELGTNLANYSYIKLDSKGNISAIRNHDVGDGGITVGVGIYVKSSDKERIKMLQELGVDWSDTTQWVPIETVKKAFANVSKTYENKVNNCLAKLNKTVSQAQFDALFAMAYNRPALFDKGGAVYELLSENNTNINDWRDALIAEYKTLKNWNTYKDGWTHRIDDELELYFYNDYKRTH